MYNDDINPDYMFQTTATELLTRAVSGDINLLTLAKTELANRGLDQNGQWVGFEQAEKIHFPNN